MDKVAAFTQDGPTTTLKLEFSAATSSMIMYATAAAKFTWERGYGDHGTEETPVEFDDLTNQQKVDIMLDRVARLFLAEAETQMLNDAPQDAQTLVDIEEIKGM